jgi:hypothetical protein
MRRVERGRAKREMGEMGESWRKRDRPRERERERDGEKD